MSDSYRDKIAEIRARRQGGLEMGRRQNQGLPQGMGGGVEEAASAALGSTGGASSTNRSGDRIASNIGGRSYLNTAAVQETSAVPLFAPGTSPFGKDTVSLSLEGQLAMMEQRGANKLNPVDLGYTNRSNILPVKNGIYVKVEPPGTYRLAYHNRTSTN